MVTRVEITWEAISEIQGHCSRKYADTRIDRIWSDFFFEGVLLILFMTSIVSLYLTLHTVPWTHDRQGASREARRKLKEPEMRLFWLVWQPQEQNTRYPLPLWLTHQTQPRHGSHATAFWGGAHTSLLHKVSHDQASTSWCTQCFKGSQLLYSYLQNVVWESLNVPSQLIFSLPTDGNVLTLGSKKEWTLGWVLCF